MSNDMLVHLVRNLSAVLIVVVFVAMILERALSVLFEWRIWRKYCGSMALRTPVAFAVAAVIVVNLELNIFHFLFLGIDGETAGAPEALFRTERGNLLQLLVSAAIVAGGSKGAMRLFQGVLGFGRDAIERRIGAVSGTEQREALRSSSPDPW